MACLVRVERAQSIYNGQERSSSTSTLFLPVRRFFRADGNGVRHLVLVLVSKPPLDGNVSAPSPGSAVPLSSVQSYLNYSMGRLIHLLVHVCCTICRRTSSEALPWRTSVPSPPLHQKALLTTYIVAYPLPVRVRLFAELANSCRCSPLPSLTHSREVATTFTNLFASSGE